MYEYNLLLGQRVQDVRFRAACAGAEVKDEPKLAGNAAFHAHMCAIAAAQNGRS